jgi:hypothetical protein
MARDAADEVMPSAALKPGNNSQPMRAALLFTSECVVKRARRDGVLHFHDSAMLRTRMMIPM